MTDSRCIPVEELARIREMPAGAPERAHVDRCPRCRAALLALAEFERADESLPAEAGAGRARARLDAVIDSLTAPPALAGPAGDRPGWLRRLFAPPALRFATGFAVVAVVAASAWLLSRPAPERSVPAPGVVRGEAAAPSAAAVRAVADGWEVTWPAVAGAESYDVVFLDRDLHEVARVERVPGTRLALVRGALPAGLATGVPLLVEVDARAGGGVLRMSVPAPIVLQ